MSEQLTPDSQSSGVEKSEQQKVWEEACERVSILQERIRLLETQKEEPFLQTEGMEKVEKELTRLQGLLAQAEQEENALQKQYQASQAENAAGEYAVVDYETLLDNRN